MLNFKSTEAYTNNDPRFNALKGSARFTYRQVKD